MRTKPCNWDSGDLESGFPELNRARGRKSNCWMAFPPDHTENAAGKVHSNVVGEPLDMCCLSVLGHTFPNPYTIAVHSGLVHGL